MRSFTVSYTKAAYRTLKKMDAHTRRLILGWVEKNLIGCEDPRLHGKGLTADRSGQWRCRVGDYRIIADIQDNKVIILVLTIGHRSEIY